MLLLSDVFHLNRNYLQNYEAGLLDCLNNYSAQRAFTGTVNKYACSASSFTSLIARGGAVVCGYTPTTSDFSGSVSFSVLVKSHQVFLGIHNQMN